MNTLQRWTEQPQWSPPLAGGNTPTYTFADVTKIVPQWGPPLTGGSTFRNGGFPPGVFKPQWSLL